MEFHNIIAEDFKNKGGVDSEGKLFIVGADGEETKIGQIKGEIKEGLTYRDEKNKLKISIPAVTRRVISENQFKTIYESRGEDVYYFKKGIWVKGGREIIQTEVERLLGELASNNIVREVESKVKRLTAISKEEFEIVHEEEICLNNGVLNVISGKLQKFNSKEYFKSKLNIDFDPKAKCKAFETFLEEVLYPEDIQVMQEWFGFCLYRKYFIKKAMILVGAKNTGKTVLLNVLNKFIGQKNISGISLQRISAGDKFALASLHHKYLNSFDDLSEKDLADSGGFKVATGGGYLTAEYKFGDSFQFMTYAKHIFATNKIPPVKNPNDDAYYERWLPIQLDNQCSKKDQNVFLTHNLTEQKELSGILNWALEGLRRILMNSCFSYDKNSHEIKYLMERSSHPLATFVNDVLKQENGNRISKEDMFKIYTDYCNDTGLPRMSKSQLGRSLERYCPYIIAKNVEKHRCWENASIKSKYGGIR